MSEHTEKLTRILDCINDETESMTNNDRAMVLLLLMEFIKCAVELDILDTLRPRKKVEVVRCRNCSTRWTTAKRAKLTTAEDQTAKAVSCCSESSLTASAHGARGEWTNER